MDSVEVRKNGIDALVCDYGEIGLPEMVVHYHHHQLPCVHLLDLAMPRCVLISREWADGLNFQPAVYSRRRLPVLASRNLDVVTLAANVVGPVAHCRRTPPLRLDTARWYYRLMPMRWWDDHEPADNLWLGVWAD